MPIYEFKCLNCSNCFEKLVFRKNQTIECPKCHSEHINKQMSRFGFKAGKSTGQLSEGPATGSSCASCMSHNCSQCR